LIHVNVNIHVSVFVASLLFKPKLSKTELAKNF